MGITSRAAIALGAGVASGIAAFTIARDGTSTAARIGTPAAASALGGGLILAGSLLRGRGAGSALAGALQIAGGGIIAGGFAGGIAGALAHKGASHGTYSGSPDGTHGGYGQPNPPESWDGQDPVGPDHPTAYTPKAGDLLPNIIPQQPMQLQISHEGNKRFLDFGTTTGNLGAGPLELRRYTDGTRPIMQIVRNSDGSERELSTDRNTFEDGPGSNHLAFNDFARYELFRAGDEGVAGAEILRSQYKESFLIIDTDHLSASIDPDGERRVNRTVPGAEVQGISPGWADTYGPGLCGQSFDISNLPDGEYVLRQSMDPGNRFAESNEHDNVRDTRVRIRGTQVSIVNSQIRAGA